MVADRVVRSLPSGSTNLLTSTLEVWPDCPVIDAVWAEEVMAAADMLYNNVRSALTISTEACNGTLPLKQALHKVPKGLRRGCVRGLDRHSCHGCSAIQQHLRQEPCCRGPSALSMDIHPKGRRHSARSHGHDIGSCHASAERLQTDSDSVTKPEATGCTLPNHTRTPLPSLRRCSAALAPSVP